MLKGFDTIRISSNLWFGLILLCLMIKSVTGLSQTFYLYNKDQCEVQRPMFFLDDTIHQRYVFGVFSICSDSSSKCRLFSTNYSGTILDSFSYIAPLDSALVFQEALSSDSNGYLLLGFRRPHKPISYMSGSPFIAKYDVHLNPVFENYIPFPDSMALHDLSVCKTNNSNFLISATVVNRSAGLSFSPTMLYEVSSSGDSIRQKTFTVAGSSQGMFFSVIPRNDTAGYWVSSDYFPSFYPNGYLYIDTNLNFIGGSPYYYNSSMFCYCTIFPVCLMNLTSSSFVESTMQGEDSVQRHYIIKHNNDGSFIKKTIMPSTNDSLDIGHFRGMGKPMTISSSGKLFVLNNTHMADGWENNPNFLEINKLDTNLNILWTRFIGGDRVYYSNSIYSTHNGVMILGMYNNMISALGYRGENIYFFSLDSLGTVNSVSSPLTHEESLVDIYPNPSTGHFSCLIEDRLKNSYIHIFNSNGQWVYSKLLKQNEEELNLDYLCNGNYLYIISSDEKKLSSGKLIIQSR